MEGPARRACSEFGDQGGERLGNLMSRLVDEGAEFEGLMNSAQGLMNSLGESSATLPTVAARLETASELGKLGR